jgi:hypothetical protein
MERALGSIGVLGPTATLVKRARFHEQAVGYPLGRRPKEEPMPHTVRKQGSKYAIVDKNTGKVKGKSDTKKKTQASARIRDQRAND